MIVLRASVVNALVVAKAVLQRMAASDPRVSPGQHVQIHTPGQTNTDPLRENVDLIFTEDSGTMTHVVEVLMIRDETGWNLAVANLMTKEGEVDVSFKARQHTNLTWVLEA